jgi:uroporphyrin-III C-methyltransferase / precorrin-2 dehydrogenase / sirohydrochlorin ferrochelatase
VRFLPISLDLRGKRVAVVGVGETALAKLRLLLKTEAAIAVYGASPLPAVEELAETGRITLHRRPVTAADLDGVSLVYAASGDAEEDARAVELGRAAGALCNWVDHRDGGDFLTPALVDRDPVTVAIGTEGAAPVLARLIKAENERSLAPHLGRLARIAEGFRGRAATLPGGAARRSFWRRFFTEIGPRALDAAGEAGAADALSSLALETAGHTTAAGHVALIGAGPGDPELLTLKARRLLEEADVVIHDRLVSPGVLDLARREACFIAVGKTPRGKSWRQDDINALLVAEARAGARVARLKSGDPGIFGRLDEEVAALEAAGVACSVVPGITAATAAAASAMMSLTRRGRNSSLVILTGYDVDGFAEHDWRNLARPGAAAAIYMGVGAATFIQGRLLMHGADHATPMTVVENASAPEEKIVAATLGDLSAQMAAANVRGPSILFLGLAPAASVHALRDPSATQPAAAAAQGA